MPVDPEISAFLEQISALSSIDLEQISAENFREVMDSSSISLSANKVDVGDVRDFEISVKDGTLNARLYIPKVDSDSLVVYFHGGGFVFGNTESYDGLLRFLCRHSGCRVLSVDYRLAPEHKFPTAVEDALAAYRWALENAAEIGADKTRIAIAGDSAGGNLCASISVICRDRGIKLPAFQALFYPVVAPDVTSKSQRDFSQGLFMTGAMASWFMKQYLNSREELMDPRYNVLSGNLAGLPETFVFTAEYDMLRDQGETFVSQLRKQGTSATGVRALGMVHGFLSFYEFSEAARNYLMMASKLVGASMKR